MAKEEQISARMFTLIYPYRNRNIERVKRSLDSLREQTTTDFSVFFVDYGSHQEIADQVRKLVSEYPFATYSYHATSYQPWNKCRALNSIIKGLSSGYCFVADVDMIFHATFVEHAISLQKPREVTYFKVGFLNEQETSQEKNFDAYAIEFESTSEATGLSMFPVEVLHEIQGFDEFYHFWGAEDTDIHVRLRNHKIPVHFYDQKVLMLHQWHPSYRSKESTVLTEDLQLSGIVQLNHQHLSYAKSHQVVRVNPEAWGVILSEETHKQLLNYNGVVEERSNKKEVVDHLLYAELPQLPQGITRFVIREDNAPKSLKFRTKKQLGKKVPSFVSLKEVNDRLLLHIISFYRNYPYIYRVLEHGEGIEFTILKS